MDCFDQTKVAFSWGCISAVEYFLSMCNNPSLGGKGCSSGSVTPAGLFCQVSVLGVEDHDCCTWGPPLIPEFGRQKQEDREYSRLSYILSLRLPQASRDTISENRISIAPKTYKKY